MGRTLQNRKRRSARSTVRQSNSRKKARNPTGNNVVAKNWNKKETLSENYSRFGLVARLGTTAGGTTRRNAAASVSAVAAPAAAPDPLALRAVNRGLPRAGEVRVERDADGRIVRVMRAENPLNDPLRHLDSDEDEDGHDGEQGGDGGAGSAGDGNARDGQEQDGKATETDARGRGLLRVGDGKGEEEKAERVVDRLEWEAAQPVEKFERHQSTREVEWLRRLLDRHGDDAAAMARDPKLNPFQQTAADIKRRLRKAGLVA